VARRFVVCSGLLYTRRKKQQAVAAGSNHIRIAPVLHAGPQVEPIPKASTAEAPMIELKIKGARVLLPGDAPSSMVAAAIKALRGLS